MRRTAVALAQLCPVLDSTSPRYFLAIWKCRFRLYSLAEKVTAARPIGLGCPAAFLHGPSTVPSLATLLSPPTFYECAWPNILFSWMPTAARAPEHCAHPVIHVMMGTCQNIPSHSVI